MTYRLDPTEDHDRQPPSDPAVASGGSTVGRADLAADVALVVSVDRRVLNDGAPGFEMVPPVEVLTWMAGRKEPEGPRERLQAYLRSPSCRRLGVDPLAVTELVSGVAPHEVAVTAWLAIVAELIAARSSGDRPLGNRVLGVPHRLGPWTGELLSDVEGLEVVDLVADPISAVLDGATTPLATPSLVAGVAQIRAHRAALAELGNRVRRFDPPSALPPSDLPPGDLPPSGRGAGRPDQAGAAQPPTPRHELVAALLGPPTPRALVGSGRLGALAADGAGLARAWRDSRAISRLLAASPPGTVPAQAGRLDALLDPADGEPDPDESADQLAVTARYTAATWEWAGFPDAELLVDDRARNVFGAVNSFVDLSRRRHSQRPSLRHGLAWRHLLIDRTVELEAAPKLVELAAGLSPRAVATSADPAITCCHVDLAPVIATVTDLLERTPEGRERLRRPNLHLMAGDVVELDITAIVGGVRSTVVTEGLCMYLTGAEQRALWTRIAQALQPAGGTLVFDQVPFCEQPVPGRIGRWVDERFSEATGGFVRDGRTRSDIEADLLSCGFASVEQLEPTGEPPEMEAPGTAAQTLVFVARL